MPNRFLRAVCLLLAAATVLLVAAGQAAGGRDWSKRLAQLDPSRPAAYFELAEEVADAAKTGQEEELARTLYGLAGALDRDRYARSAALGIASLTDDPRVRRRLQALASLLARGEAELLAEAAAARTTAIAAVSLSESFSFFRRGQGPRALGLVKSPETAALLERFGAGLPGGADRFREDCRAFKGGLRPELAPPQRLAMLAIEEAVLASAGSGQTRGWGSVLVETGGQPLLEVDAANLDQAFGVDLRRPYWRGGHWVAQP